MHVIRAGGCIRLVTPRGRSFIAFWEAVAKILNYCSVPHDVIANLFSEISNQGIDASKDSGENFEHFQACMYISRYV